MSDYIKREDAVNVMYTFLKQAHDMDNNNDRLEEVLTIAKNVVHEIPSADVVEVVRCKDCKCWTEWSNGTGSCSRFALDWIGTDADDFCSMVDLKKARWYLDKYIELEEVDA